MCQGGTAGIWVPPRCVWHWRGFLRVLACMGRLRRSVFFLERQNVFAPIYIHPPLHIPRIFFFDLSVCVCIRQVRLGVIRQLADFFREMNPQQREKHLNVLVEVSWWMLKRRRHAMPCHALPCHAVRLAWVIPWVGGRLGFDNLGDTPFGGRSGFQRLFFRDVFLCPGACGSHPVASASRGAVLPPFYAHTPHLTTQTLCDLLPDHPVGPVQVKHDCERTMPRTGKVTLGSQASPCATPTLIFALFRCSSPSRFSCCLASRDARASSDVVAMFWGVFAFGRSFKRHRHSTGD